ncbi:hypothetical protein NON20_13425 [Synechocystis sp. B12]|nr:hypothetical protein NON20_13425 [Synechocystis sp. B12]
MDVVFDYSAVDQCHGLVVLGANVFLDNSSLGIWRGFCQGHQREKRLHGEHRASFGTFIDS